METVKLCKGLSLAYKKKDGIWMNFETETGLHASIQLASTFKGKRIIKAAILNWADERLQEETDGN